MSTALTEEALSKCLKTNIYQLAPSEEENIDCSGDMDDAKCSICQVVCLITFPSVVF